MPFFTIVAPIEEHGGCLVFLLKVQQMILGKAALCHGEVNEFVEVGLEIVLEHSAVYINILVNYNQRVKIYKLTCLFVILDINLFFGIIRLIIILFSIRF